MTFDFEKMSQVVAANSRKRQEPSWLSQKRQAGLQALTTAPAPKMQKFDFRDWDLMPLPDLSATSDLDEATELDKAHLVQVGTTTPYVNLPDDVRQQGVILTDLATAAEQYADLVQPALMTVVSADENQLTAYHQAMMNNGIFVYVPQNVEVDIPLETMIYQDATNPNPLVHHVLIVTEANAKLQFVEHLATLGEEKTMASLMVEIIAKENSQVSFASLDELGINTTEYFKHRAQIGRNAKVEWSIGLMSDGNVVGDVDSELVGTGGMADSKTIAVSTRQQEIGINNRVTHHGQNTEGLINQRGVLLEQSKLVFNGIGEIIHGAHGAEAEQQNRVLMMSPDAHGDANPILLIDENDVIAGHAASVGPVDPEQMYYLVSRGIPQSQAERLVIRGYLSPVITAIPSKLLRQKMIDILERKLAHGQDE